MKKSSASFTLAKLGQSGPSNAGSLSWLSGSRQQVISALPIEGQVAIINPFEAGAFMIFRLTKEEVLKARAEFFEDVIAHLGSQPQAIDEKLEQVKYYCDPVLPSIIADAAFGDFYIDINPFFAGRMWPLAYSMWQIGQTLRIAIILQAHTEEARWFDPEEFAELWPHAEMKPMNRGQKLFLEWRFDVPEFHTNYAVREGFALGMRHMHFRTLKAIRVLAGKAAALPLPSAA